MDINSYIIEIVGTQQIDDEPQDVIEITTTGEYKASPTGSVFIRYKEYDEDNTNSFHNTTVKATENMVTISRGKDNQLLLELDKHHQSCYYTPAGPMIISIFTRKIEISQNEDECSIYAEYTLNFDAHNISENTFSIKVRKNNKY